MRKKMKRRELTCECEVEDRNGTELARTQNLGKM